MDSDSVCSSPRSVSVRGHDDEPRVRFMCSYGGRILPRPHDNQLRYVGGDTRIVAVSRTITLSLLVAKLSKLCASNVTVKYQLPNEDLDALISVTTDEDLENMMEEYERLNAANGSSRLRLFLFPVKLQNATSLGSLLEGSKREHWFLDALNGVPVLTRHRSEVSSMASEVPDYLFGLDTVDDWDRDEQGSKPGPGKSRLNSQHVAEAHSAPGSPVPISSPYGSTSSAPPYIDSHVIADLAAKAAKIGLYPATSEAPTPPVTKPDPEKSDNYPPEVESAPAAAVETTPKRIIVPAAAIETTPERIIVPPSRSPETTSGLGLATLKRDNSGSNLSAHGDESRRPTKSPDGRNRPLPPAEEIYKPTPVVPVVPTPEHYVDYTQAPQFVQPPAYWQMHEDSSGQVYYVAAGAAPAVMQRQPAYVQRMPATVAYGAPDPGVVPVQKMTGAVGSVPGAYGGKLPPGKAPLYRGPARPVAAMMMRAPVASGDPYAYQQVGYEGPPQQVYYTQKPTVMNPQYQPMMAGPVVEMQSSGETIVEGGVVGRVSGSV